MKQYFRSEKLKTLILALIFLPCLLLMSACGNSVDFKINFVVDGAIYDTIETQGNTTISMPNDPEKQGYTFDGWYWDKDIWNEPFTANSLLNTPLKRDMNVYAKWNVVEYTAYFCADNALIGTAKFTIEDSVIDNVPDVPEKEGYDGEWDSYSIQSNDIIINAIYTSRTYNVYFNENGGNLIDDTTYIYGIGINQLPSSSNIYRNGYKFIGWVNLENEIMNSIPSDFCGDVWLTAKWEIIEYTAYFYADNALIGTAKFTIEDSVIDNVPNVPEKVGYDGEWDSYSIQSKDIIINAIYTSRTYNVYFNENGGNLIDDTTYIYGIGINQLPSSNDICRDGYIFIGWVNLENEIMNSVPSDCCGDVWLTAKWEAIEYTAYFYADNALIGTAKFTIEDSVIDNVPNVPEKVGYDGEWDSYSIQAENIIINAIYSIKKLNVTWKNYDGTIIECSQVNYNNVPEFNGYLPVKEYDEKYRYSFSGWDPEVSNITEDTTYVATFLQIECEEFIIKYFTTQDSCVFVEQTKLKGEDIVIASEIPTREGFQFAGWNNVYEDKVYHAGDKFSIDLNLSFFAMWESNCSQCNGSGVLQNQINCSACSGTGNKTQETWRNCSGCSGSGKISYSSKCSSCNGWGGNCLCECTCGYKWWANQTNSRICAHCGKSVKATRYTTCSSCSGTGSVKAYKTCNSCSGTGGKYITTKTNCSQCSGTGKKTQTITCTFCNGKKIVKPTAPEYSTIEARKIVLKQISDYEYSLNGTNWQSSNVFENLTPSTQYTFYQRLATTGGIPFGVTSQPLTISTKSSTLFYVSYELDGGTNDINNPTQYYTNNSNVTLLSPTKEHYDFVGWKYNGNIVTEIKASWAQDIKLVATWSLHNYQIVYELNSGTTTNLTSYTIETDSFALTDATRRGYTFIGWIGSNGNVPEKNIVINSNNPKDLSFEAIWEIITYTIEYDFDGGYFSGEKVTTYTVEDEIVLCQPIKEEYDFIGWEYNNQTIKSIEKGTINNITLVAKWVLHRYDITYDLEGGINNTNPLWFNIESENIDLQNPIKDGYTFIGWTGSNGVTPQINVTIPKGSKEDRKYIANWTANKYDISFDANGGVLEITVQSVTYNDEYTLPIPTRVGYHFDGWYYNDILYIDGVWKIAENITLTAKWIANTNTKYIVNHYQQNLDDDYVLFETENLTGTSDSTIIPRVKTYSGFNSPDAQATTISPDGTKVVNYHYARGTYSLTIIKNDGTAEIKNVKYQATLANVITVTRTGYTFGGYFADETLSEQVITMPSNNSTVYIWWQEETKPMYLSYSCVSSITISGYTGTDTKLQIPTYIGNKIVKTISASSITNNETLTEIVVPNSVTSIGEGAFKGCNKLVSITLPFVGGSKSVSTSIGDGNSSYLFGYIFGCTTDTEYTYSSSTYPTNTSTLTYQGQRYYTTKNINSSTKYYYYAMYYIPQTLRNVTITNATEISANAFYGCSYLTSVTLNKEITTINSKAFYECSGLTNFTVPENTTSIESNAFYGCSSMSTLTFNEKVTTIGNYAFYGCVKVTEIDLPETLTTIGNYAFYNTRLKTLTIPSKVNSIGEHAFEKNVALTELVIPSNVKTIGSYAFSDCTQISKLTLENGITSIGNYAFQNLVVTEIVVPNSVTSIGEGAFKGCNKLVSITLPFVGGSKSVSTSIGDGNSSYLFGYIFGCTTDTEYTYSSSTYPTNTSTLTYQGQCYYTTKNINSSTKYYYAMYYIPQTLRNVTITNATGISANAFYGCSYLTSVTLNDEVATIYGYAFCGCSELENILIPYDVKTIEYKSFVNCSKLNINCQIDEQPINWNSDWNYSNCPVVWNYNCTKGVTTEGFDWICLDGKTIRIRGYSGTETDIIIPNSIEGKTVTRIDKNTFKDNSVITSITIPNSVTYIDQNSFTNLSNLQKIIIASGVTTIKGNAFTNCPKVSLLCQSSLKPVGWDSNWRPSVSPIVWSYANENGITEDGFKWALTSDGSIIIYGYSGTLDIITIPQTINDKTVCAISLNAFRDNKTLTAIHISNNITFIGAYAFSGCSNSIIYCEADSEPSGWSSIWKDSDITVYWSM